MFCCMKYGALQVIKVASGQIVRTLRFPKKSKLVGAFLDSENHYQLYGGTSDGTIRLWDTEDGSLLKEWKINQNIYWVTRLHEDGLVLFAREAKKTGNATSVELKVLNINKSDVDTKEVCSFRLEFSENSNVFFVSSPNSRVFAAVCGKQVTVFRYHNSPKCFLAKDLDIQHDRAIKCVAFSFDDSFLASGDSRGQINLWSLADGSKKVNGIPDSIKLHWHSQEVNTLHFSPDNMYLYSGGSESVLVRWQIDSQNKSFLPRLGSPVQHVTISRDGTSIAVTLNENCIKILHTIDWNLVSEVKGLSYATAVKEWNHKLLRQKQGGFIIDQHRECAVLPGKPGTLQFWKINSNKLIMEHEVTPPPRIHRTDHGIVRGNVVRLVSFSSDGSWMATVECNAEESSDWKLKFWKFDPKNSNFILFTRIDDAHDDVINRIEFMPSGRADSPVFCATASADKTFKIWHLKNYTKSSNFRDDAKDEECFSWRCRSTGFWKDCQATDLSFSRDGSILAVAFENAITLWSPFNMKCYSVLSYPSEKHFIKNLQFVVPQQNELSNAKFSALLLAATKDEIYLWNVIRQQMMWKKNNFCLESMDISSSSGNLVIYGKDLTKKVRVLAEVDICNNAWIEHEILHNKCHGICSIPISKRKNRSNDAIVILNKSYEFESSSTSTLIEEEEELLSNGLGGNEDKNMGIIAALYGKNSAENITLKNQINFNEKIETGPKIKFALFAAPPHAIAPINALFLPFMDTMLNKR